MPPSAAETNRLRDEAHRAAETLTIRAREVRQIAVDLPLNASKATRSHLGFVADQLEEVAAGLSSEAKDPDPASFWLRVRLAARKLTVGAVVVGSLATVGNGVGEAVGNDIWDRIRETAADLTQDARELDELQVEHTSDDRIAQESRSFVDLSDEELAGLVHQLFEATGYVVLEGSDPDDPTEFVADREATPGFEIVVHIRNRLSKVSSSEVRALINSSSGSSVIGWTLIATTELTDAAKDLADQHPSLTIIDKSTLTKLLEEHLGPGFDETGPG